jgi:hypothetical protein
MGEFAHHQLPERSAASSSNRSLAVDFAYDDEFALGERAKRGSKTFNILEIQLPHILSLLGQNV